MAGNTESSRASRGVLGTAVFLMAAGWIASGCGFFDTRNPVRPIVPPEGLKSLPQTSPQNVACNFANAVQFGLAGLSQFTDSLDEEFVMTFDVADSSELNLGSIGRAATTESFRLAATTEEDSLHFEFEEKQPEELGNTALYNQISYTFNILTRVGPDSGVVREAYSGSADIRLETNDFGQWAMISWDDFNDAEATLSWGRYLGEFALTVVP
jgi:hypothetical protein